MALTLVQVFFLLVVVDNSPIIPGLNSSYEADMLFYLILMTAVALPIIGFAPSVHKSRSAVNLASGGSIPRFMLAYAVTGFLAWLGMSVALLSFGVAYTPISGADRLAALVFDSVFVSATEEVTFRMALPLVMNPYVSSCFLFALFHLPIDYVTYGVNVAPIASAFFQRIIAGLVLWFIYREAGLASAMAAHFAYDGILEGAFPAGVPLGLAHLGLVPV